MSQKIRRVLLAVFKFKIIELYTESSDSYQINIFQPSLFIQLENSLKAPQIQVPKKYAQLRFHFSNDISLIWPSYELSKMQMSWNFPFQVPPSPL